MNLPEECQRLRIIVDEAEQSGNRPLYEVLMTEARQQEMAGATAHRGIMSYGAGRRIHTAKIMRLSEDLPVIVELVDSPAKITAFLATVERLVHRGLVTVEPVRVFQYGQRP